MVGGLATLCGDAEYLDFSGVSSLAGSSENIVGVFVAGTPAARNVWIVEEGLHEKLKEAPDEPNRNGA